MRNKIWKCVGLVVMFSLAVSVSVIQAQEPTPTPRPTSTPIPTRTPIVTPVPTPSFDSSAPSGIADAIRRSFGAAMQVAQTIQNSADTSLVGKVNEFANDACVAIGVLYAGDSIVGSTFTTMLISITGAMLILSLVRMGIWVVKIIIEFAKVW